MIQNILLESAKKVMQHSYSPYSQYRVGASLRCNDETIFTGTNIENASYSLALCAESAAIAAMISAGYQSIQEMVIIGSGKTLCMPCGACRQRISEFATPETKIHLADENGIQKTLTIQDLLPYAFGQKHLSGEEHS